jgi:DNA recombination protein RmuC
MNPFVVLVVAGVALALGLVLGYALASLRAQREKHELHVALESERLRREADLRQANEHVAVLEQAETRLRAAFDSLATQTLRANSEMFLQLAKESLSRDHLVAQNALKEREAAIAQMVEPLRAALEKVEAQRAGRRARAARSVRFVARADREPLRRSRAAAA